MSAAPRPGWYPDPAGTPELYRWWDGGDWTEAISESPRAPSPRLHSPARPEDEISRRRHSPLRSAVALLLCLALFLSATVGLGLVIWQDGPRLDRSGRAPSRAPADTDASPAIGRLHEHSRVATVGAASMTLPADPFTLSPDPMRVPGLLEVFFLANAPVHQRYDGQRTWSAAVLLGRLAPSLGGPELEHRGRAAVAGLAQAFFSSAVHTRVEAVSVADHAVDGSAGLLLTARVHYTVDRLPSRYDQLSVVVVQLGDGSVVAAATSVPDDAATEVVAGAARALESLTLN